MPKNFTVRDLPKTELSVVAGAKPMLRSSKKTLNRTATQNIGDVKGVIESGKIKKEEI